MTKKSTVSKTVTHRSAKTGRYVTKKYADAHPATTVKETSKKQGRTGGGGAHKS